MDLEISSCTDHVDNDEAEQSKLNPSTPYYDDHEPDDDDLAHARRMTVITSLWHCTLIVLENGGRPPLLQPVQEERTSASYFRCSRDSRLNS
jgi:hypothetical protein